LRGRGGEVVPGLTEISGNLAVAALLGSAGVSGHSDDQLGTLSPLEALQKKDAKLKERTLRLARAAAGMA